MPCGRAAWLAAALIVDQWKAGRQQLELAASVRVELRRTKEFQPSSGYSSSVHSREPFNSRTTRFHRVCDRVNRSRSLRACGLSMFPVQSGPQAADPGHPMSPQGDSGTLQPHEVQQKKSMLTPDPAPQQDEHEFDGNPECE